MTADRDRCVASGQCALIAPDVFDQREEDGLVVVLDHAPPPERHAEVEQAVHICPAQALALGTA
ncbi:putative ferredoxin (plasmid) [Streptantibioticus cattleyicolor NRRL 8057 = DSM 46488]|uniref:Ferredoxin n=1 Tax=Streptantibioticus cattleyicolor (strain ATCC 35852 / DSM 46488 / JCM 4925 / NBRC 14057 / NRRL 8057) TaxID=1003195 RepID=G8XEZ6_STREN|nr:putative ferredoxin [Streptantibioticus cattleyicolor NRRL 8057 = DSM 46488]